MIFFLFLCFTNTRILLQICDKNQTRVNTTDAFTTTQNFDKRE